MTAVSNPQTTIRMRTATGIAALAMLCVGLGPVHGQSPKAKPSPTTADTGRHVVAKLTRDRSGHPTYDLPDGSRVSCLADTDRVVDCYGVDASGRLGEHGNEIWLARIERASLTVTAIGRPPARGAAVPGSQLRDLGRIVAMIAEGKARAQRESERREAMFDEAARDNVDVWCEMCNWYGTCWNVPCTLPPTKE